MNKNLLLFAVSLLPITGVVESALATAVDFNRDIRPILADRCFKCHGPDAKQRKARLRLDTPSGITDGSVINAGHPSNSELFVRITSKDPAAVMPPPDSGLALSPDEIELMRRWIAEGAPLKKHWSFTPPRRPSVPALAAAVWPRNEIDRFVMARLEAASLRPAPRADRFTLLRRISFDLTGLPPTPLEIVRFVRDDAPNAYEKQIDRLLKSTRYGERMAVEWLDAARYADSNGFLFDYKRTMWPWRNWVINAFNRNLSYKDFIITQLAGDLLPKPTLEQVIATGFNRNHPFTVEDGAIEEEFRLNYVADRVTTMGTVFMGLTLECARCHDHKYDPISQEEFYQLSAYFNNLPETGVMADNAQYAAPAIRTPSNKQVRLNDEIDHRISGLRQQIVRPDPKADGQQKAWEPFSKTYWRHLRPTTTRSTAGSRFRIFRDNSILLAGTNPATDRHTFEFKISEPRAITGIRLEALQHESLPANGPGRSHDGSALLSHIQIARLDTNSNHFVVNCWRASSNLRHKDYPVEGAIRTTAKTGWAVPSGNSARPRSAVFELIEPVLLAAGDRLEIQLAYDGPFPHHALGCLRFSASTAFAPVRIDPTGFVGDLARLPEKQRSPAENEIVKNYFRITRLPQYNQLHQQLLRLEETKMSNLAEIAYTMVMSEGGIRDTHVLHRGRYDKPLKKVSAGVPRALPPISTNLPANRLGLATWLTRPDHPLTARVYVNRLWHQLFGVGLVKTVEDFGVQGERPSHPELLDWLATDFVDHGWDIKRLVKQILMSATYQQASNSTRDQLSADPENRQLARGPRFRLSAEMIRDSALYVSGLLKEVFGGPSVMPYQPPNLWKRLSNRERFKQEWQVGSGDDLYRRSLYTYWRRASHPPAMAAFDAPNREVCVFRRRLTNTPQQALVLLHDTQFVEAARVLAQRMLTDPGFGNTSADRIAHAFAFATSRIPDAAELAALNEFHQSELQRLQSNPDESDALLSVGKSPQHSHLPKHQQAAMMMVARVILNLGETISRN